LALPLPFFGFKLYRLTLFFTGFAIFADISLALLLVIMPPNPAGPNPKEGIIYLGTLFGTGLLGGLLLAIIGHRMIPLVGLLGGFVLSHIVRTALPLIPVWIHIVLLVVFCIIGLILIVYRQRPTVILVTSISGAFVAMIGVDLVVGSGLIYHGVDRDVDGKESVNTEALAELGGMLVMALLGMIFQFWRHTGDFAQNEAFKVHYRASDNPILL